MGVDVGFAFGNFFPVKVILMSESERVEAIILRRWDYGDKDQIVSLFSREKGRLQGIAKGAKASLKRFGPSLDLFSWVEIQFREKKNSSLVFIEQAQIISHFSNLRENYASILLASGLVELAHNLYREAVVEPEAFLTLLGSLKKLNDQGAQRRIFWAYLLKNFELLGWGLHLENCFKCNKIWRDDFHDFDVEQGGLVCENCKRSSQKTFTLSFSLLDWMSNPVHEKHISPIEEAQLQEMLEIQYAHHLHLEPDWNRFLHL